MLRGRSQTVRNFGPLATAIDTVFLVEASPALREAQRTLLCGDAPMEEIDIGYRSTSRHLPGTKVIWCEDVRLVPQGITTCFPIHFLP